MATAENIPLRLRRRRDGSLALTDAEGRVGSESRAFPAEHVFTPTTLLSLAGVGAFAMDGDTITVSLVNAAATYRVTERRPNGEIVAVVVESSLLDPPPIDADAAAAIAAARQEG